MRGNPPTYTSHIRRAAMLIMLLTALAGLCQTHTRRVLSAEQRQNIPTIYADFIERVITELAESNEPQASQTANRYMMKLTSGDNDMTANAHIWAMGLLNNFSALTDFSYNDDSEYLDIKWANSNFLSYAMRVKITREAIEGTDKADADMVLVEKLRSMSPTPYVPNVPSMKQLIKTPESDMLVLTGEHFMISTMNGDTYYQSHKGNVEPIFSERYPVESLKNLLQGAVDYAYRMEINIPMYGGKTERLPMLLKDFTSYWKSDPDFDVYCDVSPSDGGYKVVHIAKHRLLKYANITVVAFTDADFNNKDSILKCTMVLNVPQHNISNIFPEK